MQAQVPWILVPGFLGAHLISILAYMPGRLLEDPWVLVRITDGLSSMGGFAGGFLGLWIFHRRRRSNFVAYADATIFGLLPGMVFGRLACALVHDHPGIETGTAQAFAVGPWPCVRGGLDLAMGGCERAVYRFDLGLLEFVFLAALSGLVYGVYRWRTVVPGALLVLVAGSYVAVRFSLDFLRAVEPGPGIGWVDPRYAGLTPAQWLCIGFAALTVRHYLRHVAA